MIERVSGPIRGKIRLTRMQSKLRAKFKRLTDSTDGAIAILAALVLPVMLGFAALSLEYGTALLTKTENQRVSDLSAFAAAFEYRKASGDAEDKIAAARTAATALAALNGVPSGVTVTFDDLDDPTWVEVNITSDQMVYLSRLLRPDDSLTINTRARVALGEPGGVIPCILANGLPSGGGVTVNGNSGTYNAENCGIGSNDELDVNGGTLETECTALSYKKSNVCLVDGETKENIHSVELEDPVVSLTTWPTNPSDDSVCDFTGALLDDLSEPATVCTKKNCKVEDYILKPGTLCVTDFQNDFKTLESGGTGSTLIVQSGVDITISGNQVMRVRPPSTGDFQGIALYAPGSDLTLSGNPTFSLTQLSCFGLVAQSMTFNGNVTLTANCDIENNPLASGYSSDAGRPLLIQ
jgi:Flp pilus assembly protein TadG